MNPLQLSGSGNKPSSLEQSTTLDPDHDDVVGGDVTTTGDVVEAGVGADPEPPLAPHEPASLLLPISM